ncbi:MAG TPA: YqiA/YcfP family alpha/beta fold hydrolase [Patescibacteria group bacterium]|nr:YqiA/YcfP family alpha/beta fold hydrolase [Casimicrobiaceae bacterium]HYK63366.1 YqiA/YcfP family alpha/beta fold hydrolase [Patescibacteria group bacterium]
MTNAVIIVYLHGLNSSPQSVKARALGDAIGALPDSKRPLYFVPQLAHRPDVAMREVRAWIEAHDPTSIALVGSSLGGFYATHLAERYGVRAVLINPAVRPYENLVPYLGRQRNLYTGEEYELTRKHFAELQALKVDRIMRPDRYFLLVQTGDEILDWREAVTFYGSAWQSVQSGGDHAFRNFEEQIPAILRFALRGF